jgi:hypothetical protein
MSGARSILSTIVRTDRESMSADLPVSASTTLLLRNNLQHLIDQSMQYRVNWAASVSGDEYLDDAGGGGDFINVFAWAFPVTITDERRLPSFNLRMSARCNDGGLAFGTVRAFLRPVGNEYPVIFSTEYTVSSTTPSGHEENFEIEMPWEGVEPLDGLNRSYVYFDDTTSGSRFASTPRSYVPLMLVVETIPDPASIGEDGNVQLTSVSLREYLIDG